MYFFIDWLFGLS